MGTPIRVEPLKNAAGLRIEGELDASNVFAVVERLEEQARRADKLTLDLRRLEFIDSAGINAVIRAAKMVEGRGTVRIRCRPGPVRRVIEMMGIPEALPHVELRVEDAEDERAGTEGEPPPVEEAG